MKQTERRGKEIIMKKLGLIILVSVIFLGLTSCIVRDDTATYKKEKKQITEEIIGIEVNDYSCNIQILSEDVEKVEIEFPNSEDNDLYAFEVVDNILKMDKRSTTVNLEENNVIIKLPLKKYDIISVVTTNGNIELNNTDATVYRCETQNGNINGRIRGEKEEYEIAVEAENGNSNLKDDLNNREKKIEMKTQNGNIDIGFLGTD